MAVKCQTIFNIIEEMAPKSLAEDWDNVGLQLGDPRSEVDLVLIALDVNASVLEEAGEKGAGLIISHHPLLHRSLKNVRLDLPQGKLIAGLLRQNITVYSAHTNLDNAAGGVNRTLADLLNLKNTEVLKPVGFRHYYKLIVFVPEGYQDVVRDAVCKAGAGWIGNYSDCTFQARGTGTFRPREGTDPFIGKQGQLEKADEVRLETIIPEECVKSAVRAMSKAHPYEEVAYDLYKLENKGLPYGTGLVGGLEKPVAFIEFVKMVKERLRLENLRAGGDPGRIVRKAAVCGGSGADFWHAAAFRGADVLVTGDIGYHAAQDMLVAGLNFIDAGHYGTERPALDMLKDYLEERCRERGLEVQFLISQAHADPFRFWEEFSLKTNKNK